MSYEDTYLARANRFGNSRSEIIKTIQQRDFARNLAHSPNAENIYVDGIALRAILLTNQQDDSRVTLWMNTELDESVNIGSQVVWNNETWLVFKQILSTNRSYNKNTIVKTNHVISWYDEDGVLRSARCYAKSSMESIISDSFRVNTSAGLGIPMLQQTLQLIMPTVSINLEQKFIINGQGWKVIDYDNVSVSGLMYISLLEIAVDEMVDNLTDSIAGPEVVWELYYPHDSVEVTNSLEVAPLIFRDGELVQGHIVITCDDEDVEIDDNTISAELGVTANVTLTLVENSEITRNLAVVFVAEPTEQKVYYICGKNAIKLASNSSYILYKIINGVFSKDSGTVTLTDTNGAATQLATIEASGNEYLVTANSNNKVGLVRINATVGGQTVTKNVAIKPLW